MWKMNPFTDLMEYLGREKYEAPGSCSSSSSLCTFLRNVCISMEDGEGEMGDNGERCDQGSGSLLVLLRLEHRPCSVLSSLSMLAWVRKMLGRGVHWESLGME